MAIRTTPIVVRRCFKMYLPMMAGQSCPLALLSLSINMKKSTINPITPLGKHSQDQARNKSTNKVPFHSTTQNQSRQRPRRRKDVFWAAYDSQSIPPREEIVKKKARLVRKMRI
jgi:hypothetical protein